MSSLSEQVSRTIVRGTISRRQMIQGSLAIMFVAGCNNNVGPGLLNFSIPNLSDLKVGEAHLVWDRNNHIYLIDDLAHTITKFDSSTQDSQSWKIGEEGPQEGGLNHPTNILNDKEGNLLVVDRGNSQILVVDPNNGKTLDTIGEHGEEDGQMHHVRDAALAENGNLFVADPFNHRIKVFDTKRDHSKNFGEFGAEDKNHLNFPVSIAISEFDDNVYVLDKGNARVQVYNQSGEWQRQFGAFNEASDVEKGFFSPSSLSVDPLGNVYIADTIHGVVQIMDSQGKHISRFDEIQLNGNTVSPRHLSWNNDSLYVRAWAPKM